MPRRPQFCGEFIYHVMNRAAKRTRLFRQTADYITAEKLLLEAKTALDIRILSYCIMPNHWHLIVWPVSGSQLSQFMRRFTGRHAQHWQAHYSTAGSGAVYQGRYKAIPVQTGNYFYNVCRTSNGILCGRGWSIGRRNGGGPAAGGERTVKPPSC